MKSFVANKISKDAFMHISCCIQLNFSLTKNVIKYLMFQQGYYMLKYLKIHVKIIERQKCFLFFQSCD